MGGIAFYLHILLGVPWLLWQSIQTIDGAFAAIVFLGLIVGVEAFNRWTDVHLNRRKWATYAVAVYFAFLLLWSNYDVFKVQERASASELADLHTKLDGVAGELKIRNVLNDQLTKENGALAAGGRVLTDAQARIEAIRKEFLDHANKVPTKEKFNADTGWVWFQTAMTMKDQTLSGESELFVWGNFDKQHPKYDDIVETAGSLRAVAINITEKDLKNNQRHSQ